MQMLNLTNQNESSIKYSISHFPDGEVQVTLGEFSRKDYINVYCRITNFEELFILCQINDILTRHAVCWNLTIFYLMGMRMDRVMDFNRPYTLSIIANILKSFSCNGISICEPHSNKTFLLLGCDCMDGISYFINHLKISIREFYKRYTFIIPDAGAYNRYSSDIEYHKPTIITCKKERDVTTGKLLGFKILNPEVIVGSNKPLLIVDDLCDGGGTFLGIATEIKKVRPNVDLSIFVTHMVNPKGIENLSKNFDHVWFTNSYKTWENLPNNVTQIEIV